MAKISHCTLSHWCLKNARHEGEYSRNISRHVLLLLLCDLLTRMHVLLLLLCDLLTRMRAHLLPLCDLLTRMHVLLLLLLCDLLTRVRLTCYETHERPCLLSR